MSDRLEQTLAAFDAANAEDPNLVEVDGSRGPKELIYGQRMSRWLARFAPGASEPLQLAVRAQHLCRWKNPRADYPQDRPGYKRWRQDCAHMHARLAGQIMSQHGYDADVIERVGFLLRKKKLKVDPEVQTLEDVACLVFLEHYFVDFAKDYSEEKLMGIVQKTWAKMSERGHEVALTIPFGDDELALLKKALHGA